MVLLGEVVLPLVLGLGLVVVRARGGSGRARPWWALAGAGAVVALVTVVWVAGPARTLSRWAELQLVWLAPVLLWSAVAWRVSGRGEGRSVRARTLRNSARFLLWFTSAVAASWVTTVSVVQYLLLPPRPAWWSAVTVLPVGEWVEVLLPALTTFHGRMSTWAANRGALCAIAAVVAWRAWRKAGRGPLTRRQQVALLGAAAVVAGLVACAQLAPSGCQTWRYGWCEGRLTVPVDAARPERGTLTVSYLLHPATDPRPQGTLVAAMGGPAAASTYRWEMLGSLGRLAETHDVLMSDYRGFGRSTPVDCPGWAIGASTPEDVERCAARLGTLAHELGAQRAADDLEAVRTHLGLGQVDLYGESYGTFFGQVYGYRYPGSLRTLVLDSPVPAHTPPDWTYALARQATTEPLALYCEEKGTCDPAGLVQAWRDLVAQARAEGWDAPSVDQLAGIQLYGAWFVDEWAQALLRPDEAARREALATLGGRVDQMVHAEVGTAVNALVPTGPQAAYNCNDYATPFAWDDPLETRLAKVRALARERFTDAIAPFTWDEFNRASERINGLGTDGYIEEGCLYWPYEEPRPTYGTPPPVPTLVVSGLLDTGTTPQMAADIVAAWPRARALYVSGADHYVLLGPGRTCAHDVVERFVADPTAELPTECAVPQAGPRR